MSANDHQVGGSHYRKVEGEQHWDRLIRLYGLPACRVYFIGSITAYIERYQDKNGIQDLEKARHYLDKLIEEEKKYETKLRGQVEEGEARVEKVLTSIGLWRCTRCNGTGFEFHTTLPCRRCEGTTVEPGVLPPKLVVSCGVCNDPNCKDPGGKH